MRLFLIFIILSVLFFSTYYCESSNCMFSVSTVESRSSSRGTILQKLHNIINNIYLVKKNDENKENRVLYFNNNNNRI